MLSYKIAVELDQTLSVLHFVLRSSCFLSYEPMMGAFIVPVGILFTVICIFFIRIACLLRGKCSIGNITFMTGNCCHEVISRKSI